MVLYELSTFSRKFKYENDEREREGGEKKCVYVCYLWVYVLSGCNNVMELNFLSDQVTQYVRYQMTLIDV